MDNQREDQTTEANMKLNRVFYGEKTEPTEWIKNSSFNNTENANMQMDRIFNEDDEYDDFDVQTSTSLIRGNG